MQTTSYLGKMRISCPEYIEGTWSCLCVVYGNGPLQLKPGISDSFSLATN